MSAQEKCPICGSVQLHRVGVKNTYELRRCASCKHLFPERWPTPHELEYIYFVYAYEEYGLSQLPAFIFTRLNEILKTFSPYRQTNRLLDVGFGSGAFLKVAGDNGWDVYGVEFSDLAVQQAKQNGLTNVSKTDFAEDFFDGEFFDVVIMTELLEHLIEPMAFLRQTQRILRPGGLAYLTTPNSLGVSYRLMKGTWSLVSPPEHINLFSASSLRHALASNHFSRLRVYTEGVNPYEIARYFQHKNGAPETPQTEKLPPMCQHVQNSYELNQKLMSSRKGLALKNLANRFLKITRLGDSLKAYAIK